MSQSNKIRGTAQAWEQGLLGESEKHAAVTNVATQRAVEETLASHKAMTKTQKNAAKKKRRRLINHTNNSASAFKA